MPPRKDVVDKRPLEGQIDPEEFSPTSEGGGKPRSIAGSSPNSAALPRLVCVLFVNPGYRCAARWGYNPPLLRALKRTSGRHFRVSRQKLAFFLDRPYGRPPILSLCLCSAPGLTGRTRWAGALSKSNVIMLLYASSISVKFRSLWTTRSSPPNRHPQA